MATKRPKAIKSAPKEVLTAFDDLLITWPLQQARGKVSPHPPARTPWSKFAEAMETKYGIPHYQDRRESMREIVAALAELEIDLGAVHGALVRARHEATEAALDNRVHKNMQARSAEAKRVMDLVREAATRAARLYAADDPDGAFPEGPQRFRNFLADLETDPVMMIYEDLAGTVKRPSRGRPAGPWRPAVEKALRDLGVPSVHRLPLLQIVGLADPAA